VPEFGGLRDNFETFAVYRGKKSLDDEDDDASRLAGYFKVTWCCDSLTSYFVNENKIRVQFA